MKRKDDKWFRADDLRGLDDDVSSSRGRQHHLASLCRQVQQSVALTLAGEFADPVLQSLVVDRVVPAPDASRLMVLVYFGSDAAAVPLVELLRRLEAVSGHLRREVAAAITRRRAPELSFGLIRPEVPDEQ